MVAVVGYDRQRLVLGLAAEDNAEELKDLESSGSIDSEFFAEQQPDRRISD